MAVQSAHNVVSRSTLKAMEIQHVHHVLVALSVYQVYIDNNISNNIDNNIFYSLYEIQFE